MVPEEVPGRLTLAAISFARSSRTATVVLSNGERATMPVPEGYFADTSRVEAHHFFPSACLLVAVTTDGDEIVFELPAPGWAPTGARPSVYLDQNQWSTLFKAHYTPDRVSQVELAAAKRLVELANARKVRLPASSGTYAETTKFTDNLSRYRLATTILQISAGWQLRDPLEVRRAELRAAMAQARMPEHVITLEANALHGPSRRDPVKAGSPAFPDHVNLALAAVVSALSMIEVALDAEHIVPGRPTGWVEWSQKFSDWLDTEARSADKKRASVDVFLLHDLRFEIAEEAARAGLTQGQLAEWSATRFAADVARMPSLGLFRELVHERHLNKGTTWRENDLTDLIYLSCAAGYADFVVCERATAGLLRNAITKRGSGARVFRRLADAVPEIEARLQRDSDQA
jgi:hypothetical protein